MTRRAWTRSGLAGLTLLVGVAAAVAQTPPPIRYLEGHTRSPFAVAWLADGKTLLTGGFDGTIKAWDRETGKLLNTWENAGPVLSLAVSKDGLQFAAGSRDRKVRLFDAPLRDPLPTFVAGAISNEPVGLVVSPDGTAVYSADKSALVRTWNAQTGAHVRDYPGSPVEVTSLSLTADGKHLLAGCIDGSFRIWNTANAALEATLTTTHVQSLAAAPDGKSIAVADKDGILRTFAWPTSIPRKLSGHNDVINGVALSKNGTFAVSAGNDQIVQVVNAANGQLLRNLPNQPGPATALALSPDDTTVATGSATGILKFWKAADGTDLRMLAGHEGPVFGVGFDPSGKQVASVGNDATIRVWDIPKAPVDLAGNAKPVQVVAVSVDGKQLAVAGGEMVIRLYTPDGKPGPVLQGHKQPLTSLTFSADGTLLASGDASGILRIWKTADKSLVSELAAHAGPVSGLSFHPAGKTLLSCGGEGSVKLWDVALPVSATLAGHADAVNSVALSPDGKFIVSGGNDQTVRLFDALGKPVKTLGEKLGVVSGVAVNAKNTLIAASSASGLVHVWTADGKDAGTLGGHVGPVHAVAFQPATDKIATAGQDGTVRLWTLPVLPRQLPEAPKPVAAVRVSPNGQSVVIAAADNTGKLFNLADGKPLPVLNGHTAALTSVAWKADSTQLVTGGNDKTLRLWTAANGTMVKAFEKLPIEPRAVAMTPDAAFLLWGGADNIVHQVNAADGTETRMIPGAGGAITSLVTSKDGQFLIAGAADGGVRVHKVADGAAVTAANHGAAVHAIAISADGMKLVSGGADNQVKLWNAANGAAIAAGQGHAAPVTGVDFNAASDLVASCSTDGTVRLWDLTGKCLQSFAVPNVQFTSVSFAADNKTIVAGAADGHTHVFTVTFERLIVGHEGPVTSVAFAPNGQWVVSGGNDKTVRSWNVADGKQVFAFAGCTDIVTRIAVSQDSTLVAASCQDKIVRTWTLGNGQPVGMPITLPAPMRGISLSPDAKWVAISGDDNLARIHDLATGRELERFPGHTGVVSNVVFGSTGKTLATTSVDKSVRLWTVSAHKVLAADPMKAHAVQFTKDGNQFITSGEDKLVKLWDMTSGQLVRQYGGADTPLRRIAIRADGAQIAAGSTEAATDKSLYLWDFATAGVTAKIATPAAVTGVSYSPDGSLVVAAEADNHLRVYRALDGKLLEDITGPAPATAVGLLADNRTIVAGWASNAVSLNSISLRRLITGHEGPVTCVTFNPKGDLLLTGGNDRTVRVWSTAEGKQVSALAGSADVITSLVVTADGQKAIAGCNDKNARVWNLAAVAGAAQVNPEYALPMAAPVRSVAVNAGGTRLAIGGDDNQVHVFDLVSVKELERFVGHTGPVMRLAFSADGKHLMTGSNDRTAQFWPLNGLRAVAAHQGPATRLVWAADGKSLLTSGTDKLVLHWNAATLEETGRFDVQAPVRGLSRPAASLVATVSEDLQLRLWKTGQPQPLAAIALPAVGTGVTVSPQGDRVVVGCADKILRNFGIVTKDGKTALVPVQECVGHADQVLWASFDEAGKTVYTASLDRTVRRWQVASAAPRGIVTLGGPAECVGLSPDGKLLAATSGKDVVLVGTADSKIVSTLTGHEGRVLSLAWHPTGQFLVSAASDQSLRLWTVKGEPVKAFEGLDTPLYSVTFSVDGAWMVGGGKSKALHVWNFADPKQTKAITGHNAPVYRVMVNAANTRIASLDYSGEICIWDVQGNLLHHQALPVLSGHSLAYSPDGKDLAVTTQDHRVLLVTVPPPVQ